VAAALTCSAEDFNYPTFGFSGSTPSSSGADMQRRGFQHTRRGLRRPRGQAAALTCSAEDFNEAQLAALGVRLAAVLTCSAEDFNAKSAAILR
jgi:hypothetical protein